MLLCGLKRLLLAPLPSRHFTSFLCKIFREDCEELSQMCKLESEFELSLHPSHPLIPPCPLPSPPPLQGVSMQTQASQVQQLTGDMYAALWHAVRIKRNAVNIPCSIPRHVYKYIFLLLFLTPDLIWKWWQTQTQTHTPNNLMNIQRERPASP